MGALYRFFSGAVSGLLSLLTPVTPTILCALAFVAADFVSGVAADRIQARRNGKEWFFESRKARRTIFKAGFLVIAITMMWLLESCVLDFVTLNITKLFAGFACGVELWSFLENASQLSDAPLFEWLKRYVRRRIEREVCYEQRTR